ncbi:uncharacterized protein METZ01_LOCUS972 [marine metagenome]|uniref:Uncharacterized protein n=1 Tax=marine metagenome TaxID=408172 RepID=A0A381N391_9ZZZZ
MHPQEYQQSLTETPQLELKIINRIEIP